MNKNGDFTVEDVKRYRSSGECPNCGSILMDKGGFSRTKEKVERKIQCSYCGVVFFSTYKFDKLVFDGWMYGGEIDGGGLSKAKGKDIRTQKSGRSDGHTGAKTNRSKRSTLGSGGGSTKKRSRKRKPKKDKG